MCQSSHVANVPIIQTKIYEQSNKNITLLQCTVHFHFISRATYIQSELAHLFGCFNAEWVTPNISLKGMTYSLRSSVKYG